MSGRKVVGVLGGMGPDATVDFFARLVAATHAGRDQDHLRILIDNDPTVPDRTAAIEGRGPSPAPRLAAMARGLVAQGADVLVMPCNSAHAFADAIVAAAAPVPFLDLIATTVRATRSRLPAVAAVGLLATDGTLAARLYHDAYAADAVRTLSPLGDDQRTVMDAIYAVKSGAVDDAVRARLRLVAERLAAGGAEAIVAGCTEIPLLLADGDVRVEGRSVPVVSSTDALVAATVALAGGG
ncbi:MAG: amino acid racemase [bacterium]|nr:amino acid racemase [bacterium]